MVKDKTDSAKDKLVSFFFEIGTLRKILRSHRQTLLTDDLSDNIASHSFRVAMIGLFLAKLESVDPFKVVVMCLLHDIEETRAGDQNWIHKKFVKVFEEEIRKGQLKSLPQSENLQSLSREYQERITPEAKVAKDADLLDQILLLREYSWQGNKEAARWLKEGNQQEKLMFTKSAKNLAQEAFKQNPSQWWNNLWTSKRRSI